MLIEADTVLPTTSEERDSRIRNLGQDIRRIARTLMIAQNPTWTASESTLGQRLRQKTQELRVVAQTTLPK